MNPGKVQTTLLFLATSTALWGQAVPMTEAPAAASDMMLPKIMAYILVGTAALLFIVTMYYVVYVNQYLYNRLIALEAAKNDVQLPEPETALAPSGDSFWTKMRKQYWENAVPIEQESRIISTHDFDGIRELDNSLPPWWVNMFILTVIWAAIFMFYYHFGGGGPTQVEYYEQEVAEAKKEIAIALAGQSNAVDEANVTALVDASALGEGELIFKNSCVSCHGQSGEGGVGPNMTDEYWIHGGGIKNVFKTIKYGVPEKGMIAWSAQLKPADMQKVASYILTLEGTNPPNPKAPQGVVWKEEVPATTPDSLTKPQ
ncbi:MAG: cbb3-type cytochrome c oxidase N-terminal domain-containing protein [Saprospiraceae bacterium]